LSVREELDPLAAFELATTGGRLPQTRSKKILHSIVKKIANGDQRTMPATIEEPKVLDEIGRALKSCEMLSNRPLFVRHA